MTPYNLINELRAIPYCVYRLIDLNMELEVKNHEILGLSHHQEPVPSHPAYNSHGNPKFNKYGEIKRELDHPEWAELPMPNYRGQGYHSPLGLLEEISRLEEQAEYYRKRILDCRWSELLDLRDQNLLWELYMLIDPTTNKKRAVQKVAEKYGYSKPGLYKHINSVLNVAILGKKDKE